MICKLTLKNSDKLVLVDDNVYDYLQNDPYLTSIGFLKHLRIHSGGYAFFQKNWPLKNGTYRNETIYLHKLIAMKFIEQQQDERRLYVTFKNSNRLDCRLENLEWAPLSKVVRNTSKTDNKLGIRGVVKDSNKFRAIIHYEKQRINLGLFDTLEEAALAYNKKSEELFGITKSLNKIPGYEPKEETKVEQE
jgi:hypothetical protein